MVDLLPSWVLQAAGIVGGAGGLLFVVWWLTQRWTQRQFELFAKMIRDERKEQLEAAQAERQALRAEMREERDRQFQLIREERKNDYEAQAKIGEAMTMIAAQMGELKTELSSQGRDLAEIKAFIFRHK